MSEINDGGQAYPQVIQRWNETFEPRPGMSLRDWFAGQAFPAVYADLCKSQFGPAEIIKRSSERSFDVADAMLAAREVKP